jgi:hypothetical protein
MDIHGISVRFPEGAGDFSLILVLRSTQPPIQRAIRGWGGGGGVRFVPGTKRLGHHDADHSPLSSDQVKNERS